MKKIISKVLATSLALTMVFASANAATKAEVKAVEEKAAPAIVEQVEEKAGLIEAIEAKAAEEIPVEVVKEEAVVPAAEAEVVEAEAVAAPVAAEAPVIHEEAEPVVWNISASENDDVVMMFYPIIRLADSDDDVTVLEEDVTDEFGDPDEEIVIELPETIDPVTGENVNHNSTEGVVEISGTGAMEDEVYKRFITEDSFVAGAKAAFKNYYGVDVDVVYDADLIESPLDVDRYAKYIALADGEGFAAGDELFVTEELREALNPSAFLAYNPTTIIIHEGVTNVSEMAFICCTGIETVILPSTIEVIEPGAFEYCAGLKTIIIPENADIKEGAFNYCYGLRIVALANDAYYNPTTNGGTELYGNTDEPLKNLSSTAVYDLVHNW